MENKALIIGLGNIGFNYDIKKKYLIHSHAKALMLNNKFALIQYPKFLSRIQEPEFLKSNSEFAILDPISRIHNLGTDFKNSQSWIPF